MRRRVLAALAGLVWSIPVWAQEIPESGAPADPTEATAPAAEPAAPVMAGAAAAPKAEARSGGKSDFVRILGGEDFARYQALYKLAAKGDVEGVRAGLAQLQNRLLSGHVLARAYLAPASSVDGETLRAWLDKYANHPEAERIHTLARRKDHSLALKDPEKRLIRGSAEDAADLRPEMTSQQGSAVASKIRQLLREGQSEEAEALLTGEAKDSLPANDYNNLMTDVAAGHYYSGRIAQALKLATEAAQEREHAPLADWIAGLANWRQKDYAAAARHFEAMAVHPEMTSWLKTAAGFWAGRSYIAAGEPHKARPLLDIAATKPRTFYGLLALRLAGEKPPFTWSEPKLDPKSFQKIVRVPQVARAVALAQLGQKVLAEDVMVRAQGRLDPALEGPFIALAGDMGFPAAQYFAASAAKSPALKAAAYPIMRVQPKGGYSIDPALVHAIVRQESRFEHDVESVSGARGLMQVLPSTAARVANDPSLDGTGKARLYDPALNLSIGQRYIEKMMRFASPDGDLFQTAVAYNGGPGNLQKWAGQIDHGGDPLVFIESLPSRETRGYVERVMANMWIYQMRMGKPTTTLDQVAAGRWPIYQPSSRNTAAQ